MSEWILWVIGTAVLVALAVALFWPFGRSLTYLDDSEDMAFKEQAQRERRKP